MKEKSRSLLEFDIITKSIRELCFSADGQAALDAADFVYDTDSYTREHDAVELMRFISEEQGAVPPLSFFPIAPFLEEVDREGAFLDGEQLYAIALYIDSADTLARWMKDGIELAAHRLHSDKLGELAEAIDPPRDLARSIFSVLESNGEVKENHPELRAVRKRLGALRRELMAVSASYLKHDRDIYQTDVPSQKDGRIVLPVKAGFKNRVNGIVHDVSERGATLYIEPADIVEKNNEVAIQEHELRLIVIRILKKLSEELRGELHRIAVLFPLIAEIDLLNAKALYSRQISGLRPELCTAGFSLQGARHPLLGAQAVPIDVELEEDTKALIISGPNAGGKTVSLKTIGLSVLMNQFGIQIPVKEGSRLPLYSSVYADIGDNQSIEASLSTYSGHMSNIAAILRECDQNSLVLLDELGSGTDPAEGSLIAAASLEAFLQRGVSTVVTSHHGLLKNFGYTRKGAKNASMDFDERSHMPTYRVLAGIPGDSHAFDIARRSGLPEEILERAREYGEGSAGEIGEMIRELEQKNITLRKQEAQLHRREAELKEQKRAIDLERLRVRQKENALREKGLGSLERFLDESRKGLENLVRELREGEINREKTKKVKSFLSSVEHALNDERGRLQQGEEATRETQAAAVKKPSRAISFKAGDEVYVPSYKKAGELIRREKGAWLVALGPMKIRLKEDQLEAPRGGAKNKRVSVSYSASRDSGRAAFQIDLRGMRLDEAVDSLSRQLDNALVQGMKEFSVIHGTGEGILQKGVRDYLASHPGVRSFEFAHPDQGGAGKTVVYL